MFRLVMRISVILLLLLAGASLYLGVRLYQQRIALKGSNLKLIHTIKQVAATIEAEENSDKRVEVAENQLKGFKTMDAPLTMLVKASGDQLDRLNGTRTTLTETQDNLEQANAEIEAKTQEIASARKTIKERDNTIEEKNGEIAKRESDIRGLENEKTELNGKVANMKAQVDALESEKRSLTDEVATLKEKNDKLEMQINPDRARARLSKSGRQGQILYINPEWNFVVFGISEKSLNLIVKDTELLVHRDDKLVGRIKVTAIVEGLAVAEIENDWQQMQIEKGDAVIGN